MRMKEGLLALAALAIGCPDAKDAERPAAAAQKTATTKPSPAATSTAAADHGGRRFREAAVYLDGTPIAVIKFGELPPALGTAWHTLTTSEGETMKVRRFNVGDYLEALGVDLKKVQALHFYGGRERIGILPGAELRKRRKEIQFSFTQSETGKPRMHWPREVAISDKIDMINDLTVYAEKAPPLWNEKTWRLEIGGQPVDTIPYAANGELRGGTRLYVDGKLARTIKRNALGAPSGSPPRWSLAAQIAAAGVALDQVRALDLIDGDRLARRVEGPAIAELSFEVAERSGGRLSFHPGAANAEAVLVYVKSAPVKPEER